MDKALSSTRMGTDMREHGRTTKEKDLGQCCLQGVVYMLENGEQIKLMEMAC